MGMVPLPLHPKCGVSPPTRGQRTVGRPQSPYGDYRPNMDAENNPPIDTTPPSVPPTQSLADFDSFTLEQMGLSPPRRENPVRPRHRHLYKDASRRRRQAGEEEAADTVAAAVEEAEAAGADRGGPYYPTEESITMARAWYSITEDAAVGTDQTESGFWSRVLTAYDAFKPRGAVEWNVDRIRKKWWKIQAAIKRFSGIH